MFTDVSVESEEIIVQHPQVHSTTVQTPLWVQVNLHKLQKLKGLADDLAAAARAKNSSKDNPTHTTTHHPRDSRKRPRAKTSHTNSAEKRPKKAENQLEKNPRDFKSNLTVRLDERLPKRSPTPKMASPTPSKYPSVQVTTTASPVKVFQTRHLKKTESPVKPREADPLVNFNTKPVVEMQGLL